MANKQFQVGNQTYTIDSCINGTSQLPFYDSLAQIALRPSLREGTILSYWKQGLEGLFSQLQALVKSDNRMVKTNPYYWTEYTQEETIALTVLKSGSPVGNPGDPVTLTLAPSEHSSNGKLSKAKDGYRAYCKELKLQGMDITGVSRAANGAHTITVTPLNGETLDFTKLNQYTLLVDSLRMYTKGDPNCIVKKGLTQNPPLLRKGYVQKFEDGICVNEDEIDGYAYENEFHVVRGISALTGKAIDMWCIPQINEQLQTKVIDSININTLIGIRDDVKQKGFDGLVTTADQQGMFSAGYDPAASVSLRQLLMTMIRNVRKIAGCTDYMLLHDFGFGIDWAEGIAQMVKDSSQSHVYALFGTGGTGVRDFQYYDFKNFSAFGYHFRTYLIDMFDSIRYGNLLADFAMLLPACQFKDTNGKTVPPVTYVNIQGCEPAKQKSMWVDDTRQRGCRSVDFYVKHSYGMEIHAGSKMGILRKKVC